MKRIDLSSLDRRTAIGGAIVLASLICLAVGLFAVVSAFTDDPVKLPSQGSIDEIVNDNNPTPTFGPGVTQAPLPTGPAPVRIQIDHILVDAPVITLGLQPGTNDPAVPDRGDQVAWYNFSAPPGQGNNAVFAAHVDWQTPDGHPIAGAFYRLRELEIGDPITVTLEDGSTVEYRVTGNVATTYNDPNVVRSMEFTSHDVITLITCGGQWIKNPSEENGGNYTHRIIVRAERVTDSQAATLAQ